MSEPVNALVIDKDKPPASACSCERLKGELEAAKERLDFVEKELALLCGKEGESSLLSRIGRKLALKTVAER